MTAHPTVSVIVAAYNAEKTIQCCLDSILAQSYKSFELIVVDDHSSDQTAAITQRNTTSDSRIRYFKNENGKGASSARNMGLDKAVGTYVLFLDADDWMLSTAIDELLMAARRADDDLTIAAHVQYRGKDAQRLNNFGRGTETSYEGQGIVDCLFEYLDRPYKNVMLVHCWGKLFKREIINKHGIRFEESLSQLEDLNFVFSYIRHIRKITFLPAGLYFHRIENDGRSMSTKTGMDDRTPEKFSLALSALETCLNTLWPENQDEVQRRVGAATASLLLLAILRLCRAYARNPSWDTYQRVRSIASSPIFHAQLRYLTPRRDEAVLLYAACRTKIPALVFAAGMLRIYYLRIRAKSSTASANDVATPKQMVEPGSKYLTVADN